MAPAKFGMRTLDLIVKVLPRSEERRMVLTLVEIIWSCGFLGVWRGRKFQILNGIHDLRADIIFLLGGSETLDYA